MQRNPYTSSSATESRRLSHTAKSNISAYLYVLSQKWLWQVISLMFNCIHLSVRWITHCWKDMRVFFLQKFREYRVSKLGTRKGLKDLRDLESWQGCECKISRFYPSCLPPRVPCSNQRTNYIVSVVISFYFIYVFCCDIFVLKTSSAT